MSKICIIIVEHVGLDYISYHMPKYEIFTKIHALVHPPYRSIHTERIFIEIGSALNVSIERSNWSIHPANGLIHSWMGRPNMNGVLKDFTLPATYRYIKGLGRYIKRMGRPSRVWSRLILILFN